MTPSFKKVILTRFGLRFGPVMAQEILTTLEACFDQTTGAQALRLSRYSRERAASAAGFLELENFDGDNLA